MDTSAWQNFHLMAGGAAAALTGLIFVALSLHTKAIMAHPLFRDRAFASIQSLLALVFLSGAVLVPGQPPLALGLEVELVAIYFLIRSVYAVWLLWLAALGTSGVCLMRDTPGGFYLLALSRVYMFGSNVWNAWVLIAEVSE
jgi:hypothetical protein